MNLSLNEYWEESFDSFDGDPLNVFLEDLLLSLDRFSGRNSYLRALTKPPKPGCGASRITLEVTGVRVERLQDITEDDARAEGVEAEEIHGAWSFVESFSQLWDDINDDRAPWASNPWVWVLSFRRVLP